MKGKSSGPDCGLSCHVSVGDMRAGPVQDREGGTKGPARKGGKPGAGRERCGEGGTAEGGWHLFISQG